MEHVLSLNVGKTTRRGGSEAAEHESNTVNALVSLPPPSLICLPDVFSYLRAAAPVASHCAVASECWAVIKFLIEMQMKGQPASGSDRGFGGSRRGCLFFLHDLSSSSDADTNRISTSSTSSTSLFSQAAAVHFTSQWPHCAEWTCVKPHSMTPCWHTKTHSWGRKDTMHAQKYELNRATHSYQST